MGKSLPDYPVREEDEISWKRWLQNHVVEILVMLTILSAIQMMTRCAEHNRSLAIGCGEKK